MTATERYQLAALDAYNDIWRLSDLKPSDKRIAAFNAAFDAAKSSGASAREATQAADFARDEAT